MMEREHGAGRMTEPRTGAEPDHIGEVTEMVVSNVKPVLSEDERHRRVMASAERVMRKHRNVLAALAESERQDRAAEVGHANIRRGLAG